MADCAGNACKVQDFDFIRFSAIDFNGTPRWKAYSAKEAAKSLSSGIGNYEGNTNFAIPISVS